jgi:elongation factor P
MQIKATQLRKGMIIMYNSELHIVTDYQHITPGKGVACMQAKMKNLISGKNAENRFMSDESIEKVSLATKAMEYLYNDGQDHIFMDLESYEQFPLSGEVLGEKTAFLTPNIKVDVQFHGGSGDQYRATGFCRCRGYRNGTTYERCNGNLFLQAGDH